MTTNYPYPDPYWGYYPPAPPPPPKRSAARRGLLVTGIAALAAAAVVGGMAIADSSSSTISGSGSSTQFLPTTPGSNGGLFPNNGSGSSNGNGTPTSVGLATSQQKQGVVTVVSVLSYQSAESAGTGMILSPSGEVLTNNHVINGATSITVTVASTGKSYRADVVGTDASDDVAVLQLRNASGLTTAKIGNSSNVSVGDKIVGVGNAGGTGTLRASSGKVTALDQSITATDENGQDGERLSGLIEVNAPIISGDSGGPMYDSSGDIIGMNTAASANRTVERSAYAIPINSAVNIAKQIENGQASSKIHLGTPAFLGVGIQDSSQGPVVTDLLQGPAAGAGITPGSVITAVDGSKVSSAAALKTALTAHKPGDKVSITWTGLDGASHTATVTLAAGPAD